MIRRDRPDEIEITPEMIEAGMKILMESGYLDYERWERPGGVQLLIGQILKACLFQQAHRGIS